MSNDLRPLAAVGPDLRRFFNPAAVALVGATEDQSKFGGRCFRSLIDFGFAGRIYPVNPKYRTLGGHEAFADLASLPETPDHVGIAVAAPHVMSVLEQCAARRVPFATVFSAGFTETGHAKGRALQEEIATFARAHGIRLMGPNCNGLINFVNGFALTSTASIKGPRAAAGNVGVVAHSGGLGQVNTMWRAQQAGVPISYEISCGNDCDLDALDYARFMVEDAASEVILLVLERIPGGAKLAALARDAAAREKPLLILKLGRTEEGSRAAASHTGALTGSDVVHDAAFRQHGLIRVDDCHELYETAMLLRRPGRRPQGRGLAGMAISGGNAVLLADLGAALGLRWPDYAPTTQQKLSVYMPSIGKIGNPTDLTAAAIGQKDTFGAVLEIIVADEQVNTMVPIVTFASRADIARVRDLALSAEKTVAVLWSGACYDDPALDLKFFAEVNVPVYRDTGPLLKAVSRAAGYAEFLQRRAEHGVAQRPADASLERARAALGVGGGALTEHASKQVLAAYGLPVTVEELASSAEAAVQIARRLGRPVALKIQSPDIAHKTEAGGVRLGLTDDAAIETAFADIMRSARAHAPAARLEGVLVQEMVPAGLELLLGVTHDAVFGPVVAVALGGIFVEVLSDVVHHLAPLSAADALDMLRTLKGWKLLEGARGRPAVDIPALVDALVRLSWLAADLGDAVAAIDVNPAIVTPTGVRIADALILRAEHATPADRADRRAAADRAVA